MTIHGASSGATPLTLTITGAATAARMVFRQPASRFTLVDHTCAHAPAPAAVGPDMLPSLSAPSIGQSCLCPSAASARRTYALTRISTARRPRRRRLRPHSAALAQRIQHELPAPDVPGAHTAGPCHTVATAGAGVRRPLHVGCKGVDYLRCQRFRLCVGGHDRTPLLHSSPVRGSHATARPRRQLRQLYACCVGGPITPRRALPVLSLELSSRPARPRNVQPHFAERCGTFDRQRSAHYLPLEK